MIHLNSFFSEKHFRLIQIIFLILFLYPSIMKAQDTIVKRNDEKIAAKILEVNPTDIKYVRFDYQSGPTFTILKWELKYIIYGNGTKESFAEYTVPNNTLTKSDLTIQPSGKYYYFKNQKITEQNMFDIVWKKQNTKINQVITKAEKIKFTKNCFLVSGIALGTAGFLTYTGVFSAVNNRNNISTVGGARGSRISQRVARQDRQRHGAYLILGGIACEITSFTFNIKEKKIANIVVDLYNKTLQ